MRRKAYDRGRWKVERDRHRWMDDEPPGVGEEVRLSQVLPALLRKHRVGEDLWLNEAQASWADVVGAAIAAHTRPGRYMQGRLTVFVDSSVWLSELARFQNRELLSRVQERFSAERVKSIRLEIDPGVA